MVVKKEPIGRCCFTFLCIFLFGAGVGIGIVVGIFPLCDEDDSTSTTVAPAAPTPAAEAADMWMDKIIRTIDSVHIEANLKNLSALPHIAGSRENLALSNMLVDQWRDYGLEVQTTDYNVMLSYPDPDHPNMVYIVDEHNNVVYKSPPKEKILSQAENKTGVVLPFLAYSPKGDVTGDIVYVNFGRVEDYDVLDKHNINVSGRIVLARYGAIFRGDIVHIASQHNAIGVIIFSDPHEYAPDSSVKPYPESWWLPPSGTQRGTILVSDGDALTPDYPAKEYAYRISENATDHPLPSIPAHAVDGEVAERILSQMTGPTAPQEWQGNLNTTYRFGPLLNNNLKIRLKVSTSNQIKKISNVIGIIRGEVEPDRYVMLGNHRDAWVFGAMDPSGGTAVMMEIVRAISHTINTSGWRPRRSLMFCSWDAEEYGLIGSTEFVQEYVKTLTNRAVAYLNVDVAVVGDFVPEIGGSPLLYRTALSATSKVNSPNSNSTKQVTLYDHWASKHEMKDKHGKGMGRPKYGNLGSGSDYAMMRGVAGIPVISFGYGFDQEALKTNNYPLYHSEYETFEAVKKYVDPDFKTHRTVGQLWLCIALELSQPELLPFNLSDYAWTLNTLKESLIENNGEELDKKLPGYEKNLTEVIDEFTQVADDFMSKTTGNHGVMETRMLNDQMIQLERAFMDPLGIPGRHQYKHLIFAPSSHNSYASASFPGLVDLLYEAARDDSQWERVKQHFSVLLFTIQSASSTLKDVANFL